MTQWIPAIAPGVFFENVGDQTLVLVGNPPQVVRLSPEASELLTLIQQSPGKEIEQTPALRQLVDLGVVEDTSPSTLSRRNVLQLSAVAGAVGLSTVLLPTAAMASSIESSPFDVTGTYELPGNGTITFRLDSGAVPDGVWGKLTIDGFDDFGTSPGNFWNASTDDVPDPNSEPLTGTFVDDGSPYGTGSDNEYTVTFTEVA